MKEQDPIVIKFSGRLRKLRKEKDLTQEELAEKADISYKNLQYLESKNPTCPNLITIKKIAKAFNIRISELLNF